MLLLCQFANDKTKNKESSTCLRTKWYIEVPHVGPGLQNECTFPGHAASEAMLIINSRLISTFEGWFKAMAWLLWHVRKEGRERRRETEREEMFLNMFELIRFLSRRPFQIISLANKHCKYLKIIISKLTEQ